MSRSSPRGRRSFSARPHLESLEDRLLPTATAVLDPTFGTRGAVPASSFQVNGQSVTITHVALQSDGKVVLEGAPNGGFGQAVVIRLTAGGALDPSFGSGGIDLVPLDDGVPGYPL